MKVTTKSGELVTQEATITLDNGKEIRLRELSMFPGMLNVSVDDTLVIYPRATNSVNIRSE